MQAYSEYKDSGEGWIGTIPSHWRENKFKVILRRKEKVQNANLSCGAISFGEVVRKDSEKIPHETRLAYQEVLAGEFLINPLNLNFDLKSLRIALSRIDVVVSSGYIVLENNSTAYSEYLRWLLFTFDIRHMKTLGAGIRQTITFHDIGNCLSCLPPIEEQKSIANYLDRETARIDQLITEKQNFIKLLKEKRQALISHVVTKGLDPNVKMKDSGLEWIGEVPEGWEITRLKFLVSELIDTEHKTIPFVSSSQYHVIRTSDIKEGELLLDQCKRTDLNSFTEWTRRGIPASGDLILTREAPAGEACIVPNEHHVCLGQRTVLIKNTNKLLPEYLLLIIYSDVTKEFIENISMGSTVKHLNMSDIPNIPVFCPDVGMQREIIEKTRHQTEKLKSLEKLTDNSIELLKEHRTTLISAAVTGKIDVRDHKEVTA